MQASPPVQLNKFISVKLLCETSINLLSLESSSLFVGIILYIGLLVISEKETQQLPAFEIASLWKK